MGVGLHRPVACRWNTGGRDDKIPAGPAFGQGQHKGGSGD